MSDSSDEMEALSGQYEDYVEREREKENKQLGQTDNTPIKTISKAILEREKHGQLCPDTINYLNKIITEEK